MVEMPSGRAYRLKRLGDGGKVHMLPYATFGTYSLCGLSDDRGSGWFDPLPDQCVCGKCKKNAEKIG
jgi:hypothetical protein